MAVAFSTSDENCLKQGASLSNTSVRPLPEEWEEFLETDRCCQWIEEGGYKRVALQFPDEYLQKSTTVSLMLRQKTGADVFILADTSYGSCCVDEVAAQHYLADALIHYGHSCLSRSERLPVLYVFGKVHINVQVCCEQFTQLVTNKDTKIAVICAVEYNHAKDELMKLLLENYPHVISPELVVPSPRSVDTTDSGDPKPTETRSSIAASTSVFKTYGRQFKLPEGEGIKDYIIFYIGSESSFFTNLMLTCRETKFYSFDPQNSTCQEQNISINKLLMKRFYLVEKVKDAQIIGILVATLSVTKYLDIVQRLKSLISHVGKKYYVFSVGKINIAKLANFPDIDVYVLVSCPESVILDSSEYYSPIVTPYEVEIACNPDREWTGDIVLDYSNLLPGGAAYKEVDWQKEIQQIDVSLITGGVRQLGTSQSDESTSDGKEVVTRDPMAVTAVSGEKFSSHTWQGLDPKLGKTEVTKAIQGRKGIAIQYEEEPS